MNVGQQRINLDREQRDTVRERHVARVRAVLDKLCTYYAPFFKLVNKPSRFTDATSQSVHHVNKHTSVTAARSTHTAFGLKTLSLPIRAPPLKRAYTQY